MKTTFVSTAALHNSMRLTVQRAQSELIERQTELTTGRHADVGLALGSGTAQTLSVSRELKELDAFLDTNALVRQRLSASQATLGQMSENAQSMLEAFISVNGVNDASRLNVAEKELSAALGNFASLANTSSSGQFLFAGMNAGTPPLDDYLAEGSTAKQAFDDAFVARFGFTQSDPATATITAQQMTDFLETDIPAMFEGPGWNAGWSSASDNNLTSRISASETIESSVNANSDAFRKFAMAAVVGVELIGLDLSVETRAVLGENTVRMAGEAIAMVDGVRAQLGVSQSRVTKADTGIEAQKDILSAYSNELEGVDPYEAKTRLDALLTQIEASYALTARLQQLSLMNYL